MGADAGSLNTWPLRSSADVKQIAGRKRRRTVEGGREQKRKCHAQRGASSADSVFVVVDCVPESLSGCTQFCPSGVVSRVAWEMVRVWMLCLRRRRVPFCRIVAVVYLSGYGRERQYRVISVMYFLRTSDVPKRD